MSEVNRKLELEEVGAVTVAKIIDRSIRDEIGIQMLGNQLLSLVDVEGRTEMIVDFSNVLYFSSAALNGLVVLQNRIKSVGGQLCLCGLHDNVREIFAITKMQRVFQICSDRNSALKCFQ